MKTGQTSGTLDLLSSNVRLPKIDLTKFDGQFKKFATFHDQFNALIHKNSRLSNIEKFTYLISSLEGPPLSLVRSIPLTESNYTQAYEAIVTRYSNKRLRAQSHWVEIENSARINVQTPGSLRKLLDTFTENLAALKTLGFPTEQWDFVMLMLLLNRLDVDTVTRFETEHGSAEVPQYTKLVEFLNRQCTVLDTLASPQVTRTKKPLPVQSQMKVPRSNAFHVNKSPATNCILCKQNHSLYTCSAFKNKSPADRYIFCKTSRLCFNCLSSAHTLNSCRSTYSCKKCNSKFHHTLLHHDKGNTSQNQEAASSFNKPNTENEGNSNFVGSGIDSKQSNVLLATALIDIGDKHGDFLPLRCLLDSGSMTSFITERAVRKLGLKKSEYVMDIQGVDSMKSRINKGIVSLTLKPANKNAPILIADAVILKQICDSLPAYHLPVKNWSHLDNIEFADPKFNCPGSIDILLGADIFSKALIGGSISGSSDEPVAVSTIFGYVIMGKIDIKLPAQHNMSLFCESSDISLDNIVKKFWEMENVPTVVISSPEDERCERHFLENCRRDENGRYIVSLPFRDNLVKPSFPEMRDHAVSRFYSLEKRLLKDPNLYLQYSDVMQEYLSLGHMELVHNTETLTSGVYYLPHHCVIKADNITTKLRVVFNASAKYAGNKSLNECLMIGSKLQKDIARLLINFRLRPYVLCADIKMMYRMILVDPSQTDYQRILWRFSPQEELQDYRLLTLTFGTSPAPFLAIRVLLKLVEDEGQHFPLASEAIRECSYVDDFVISCRSLAETIKLRDELISLLKLGGFELRKFASNESAVLSGLPESHLSRSPISFSDSSEESPLKVLGLRWNSEHDYFSFKVKSMENTGCSKRIMLSELARVYDPLGFLSPITFLNKYLIQRLWTSGAGWDETPNDEIVRVWRQYRDEFVHLTELRIPRLVIPFNTDAIDLHGFCDASEKGFACVVYFRTVHTAEDISTHFLCAKSKVAPLKRVTIPRLELCAAVLLTKLVHSVLTNIGSQVKINKICLWSDSQIVLYWIKASPHRWKTFVANRVSFIQEKYPIDNWFHVDSANNPADIASRGSLPSNIIHNNLWWQGPSFLLSSTLPMKHFSTNVTYPVEEERKLVHFTTVPSHNILSNLLNEKSTFITIQRILSYMLRFIYNSKNPKMKRNGALALRELHESLKVLVKYTQQVHFSNEFENSAFSRPFRRLGAFRDEDGILRVGGRLNHSNLSPNSKFPMILPRSSRLTQLIVEYYHHKYFHAGFKTTQYLLLQTFWILSPRRAIKSVLSKCVRCWKMHPRTFQPPMASLPRPRVNQVKPFLHSAVDFGGPYFVTMSRHRGVRTSKAYLCVFVCMATKAVHLELASDLSTETFLSALQRFMARRGRIMSLHCDNATNFVGAHRELNLMKDAAQKETVEFHFSPPSGPHFNGLAEAGIKSVKNHLSKVIGDQILTYEEFYTTLTLIESILNSRPLTPITSDIEDINALTPGHFLTTEPLTALPVPELSTVSINRLSRWQLIQKIHQDFWRRFRLEYLHTLQQKEKWLDPTSPPTIGTLVLIRDDNSPPSKWALARIIAIHPGKDKVARVATVKTANGILKRPLVKLAPLPNV
ncbi:uncharacterized protein LOC123315852 [Coccinella septempunctata]|uniref:uncharacterized protein LOC123315852 n=1 Tax=Coccinella septempunctata TaxID=41139 RepID=UPI001D089B6D|nr:uncharacterized protein LOC123315852 [Coccinella septempunctata]